MLLSAERLKEQTNGEKMTECINCGTTLQAVFKNEEETENYQFENALWIGFFGGYGMFVESRGVAGEPLSEILAEEGASHEAVICHDCATDFCEKVPWLKKLLGPEKAHSHTAEFWKKNPFHQGWDNPRRSR